jgi:hypothetical protein
VILFFSLDGGKDEILGLRMSIFVRHPLRFSIGRALSVEPGSIMMSGWTTKHPDSLSQYNEQLRTITMETWMANRGKYNYPVTTKNIRLFRHMLREVSLSSPHWDEYPPRHAIASVGLPWSYKRTIREDNESEECNDDFSDGDENIFDETEDNEELEKPDEETHNGAGDATMSGTGDEDSTLDDKVSYLLSLAAHIPPQEREKYIQTVTIGHDNSEPLQRAELFEQAVVEAVRAGSTNTMQIDDMTTDQWRDLGAHIDFPLAADEIRWYYRLYMTTENEWAVILLSTYIT